MMTVTHRITLCQLHDAPKPFISGCRRREALRGLLLPDSRLSSEGGSEPYRSSPPSGRPANNQDFRQVEAASKSEYNTVLPSIRISEAAQHGLNTRCANLFSACSSLQINDFAHQKTTDLLRPGPAAGCLRCDAYQQRQHSARRRPQNPGPAPCRRGRCGPASGGAASAPSCAAGW